MHTTRDEHRLTLRVQQMTCEAEGVLSLRLQDDQGTDLPEWTPGAHVDLLLPGVITRQYSLCGDLDDRSGWRIAVLREPVSKGGSQAVHEAVRPGDLVEVIGPRNNFTLHPAPSYRFIAGGIGITPILPMIQSAEASGAEWSLLYGGRSRSSMAFVDQLQALGPRARVCPQDEVGLLDLESALGNPGDGTLVYCCGPEPLLTAVEDRCRQWPPGSLHVERFKAIRRSEADDGAESSFTAVLERSGFEVEVPPGRSILQALEDAGLTPDNSCREGICGTCETKVIQGTPDHRDSLLSAEERAENASMMICVGRALSERIVLDL